MKTSSFPMGRKYTDWMQCDVFAAAAARLALAEEADVRNS